MNEHEYTQLLIQQYFSLCTPKYTEPTLTVDEYLSLRKYAVWEYTHYSFTSRSSQAFENNSSVQMSETPNLPPFISAPKEFFGRNPLPAENGAPNNVSHLQKEASEINSAENNVNKPQKEENAAVRIFKSLGE